MKLTGSNDFLISLICLLFIIICQYSVFGQKDSSLLDKLKTASLLNTKGENDLNRLVINNNQVLNINKLMRQKRQYFKPTIDGPWFGPNEKTSNLSLKKKDTTFVIENASNRTMKIRSDDMNNNTSKTNSEVTVNSLSISLINLFDRIKDTLCNIIDKKC